MNLFKLEKNNVDKKQIIYLLGIKITLSTQKMLRKKVNKKDKEEYINYVLNNQLDKSDFCGLSEEKYDFSKNSTKVIAMYLPQFHDFPENVKWFGRGFSEWSNTSKTVPQYTGHYQPHIPIDVGYYNLTNTDIYKRQIELAKQHGIFGFAFYYYWFSGSKLMEKPIQNILKDKTLDFPFFMFWANEDWTRLWGGEGKDREILHKQELKNDDAKKFMDDILPYMLDSRYIKISNKPLLILYDPQKYPYEKYISFVKEIRQIAKQNGFDDLYILTTNWRVQQAEINEKEYVEKYMLDGIFEFFPQGMQVTLDQKEEKIINPLFRGFCFDIKKFIKNKKYIYKYDANLFKGCFPNWDNTARKCYKYTFIYQNEPKDYKSWLKGIIQWTQETKPKEEQFVFVNAWNEWAEGAHLEPCSKYGYAYLQATKEALEETSNI